MINIILVGCNVLFWGLLYRVQKWELKDETPEEREKRYRITLGFQRKGHTGQCYAKNIWKNSLRTWFAQADEVCSL